MEACPCQAGFSSFTVMIHSDLPHFPLILFPLITFACGTRGRLVNGRRSATLVKFGNNVYQFTQKLTQSRHVTLRGFIGFSFIRTQNRINLQAPVSLLTLVKGFALNHWDISINARQEVRYPSADPEFRLTSTASSLAPSWNFWNNPLSSAAQPIPNSCRNPRHQGGGCGRGDMTGIRKGRLRPSLS